MAEPLISDLVPSPCAFCDHLPCRCADGTPRVLASHEILRLGALTVDQENSKALDAVLDDQEARYRIALREYGPDALIDALRARDQHIAQLGRQVVDGRGATRLLREFMRAALYQAGGTPNIEAAEKVLQKLGAEPADARQLRLNGGSTLGRLERPEDVAESLADGTRKER